MPDPTLSHTQRQRLHTALSRLPACATPAGRTRLLRGFPADMRERFPPALHQGVDLDHIIDAARAWGFLPDGALALRRLIENALALGGDPTAEQELAALLDDLTAPAAAPPGADDWRALLRQADALAAAAPAEAAARRALAWQALPRPAPQALTGHRARVRAVAVTADGRIILSAGDDVTLRRWTLGALAKGEVPSRIL